MKNPGEKLKQLFGKGTVAFLVIAASILFFFALFRMEEIADILGQLLNILQPIIYGLAVAYLVNPIVNLIEKWIAMPLKKYIKKEKAVHKIARGVGIFIALTLLIALVVAFFSMLIPELYKTIYDLIMTLPSQIDKWVVQANKLLNDNNSLNTAFKNVISQGSHMLEDWLKTDLLKSVSSLTLGAFNVVNGVFDIIVGLIISIYVLLGKEQFAGQCKKILYAFMKPRNANIVLHMTQKTHSIFGKYIMGVLIDSTLMGILCFIGLSILKMPYALLVSVVVGVTNIIPFFGPFIGAVPSAVLILLTDPMKGLYFIIFILILQQIDGNIINPNILGDSTGLSAFWVVFAILLGGGLFGFIGMILGVPTFAVIYYMIETIIQQKLQDKSLPISTEHYDKDSYVDDEGHYISFAEMQSAQEDKSEKGGE